MNRKFFIAWVVVFIVWMAGSFVVHGTLLAADYALLTVVPNYEIYYAVQPMPGGVVIKQIVFDTALLFVLGVVVAFLYRSRGNA